jgi:hypothetical protein
MPVSDLTTVVREAYSFFDVSGFKAGFGRKLFTDIDMVGFKFGYPTQKRPPEPPCAELPTSSTNTIAIDHSQRQVWQGGHISVISS